MKLPQNIPNMNCLELLDLSDNKISIIPSSFYFNNLTKLWIYGNPISKVESTLICPNTMTIYISNNNLI